MYLFIVHCASSNFAVQYSVGHKIASHLNSRLTKSQALESQGRGQGAGLNN